MTKRILVLGALLACICIAYSGNVWAQAGVDTPECRAVQLAAQEAVLTGGPYKNHGELVSTAAHVVDAAVTAGEIDEECASCIMNQFARRIPIADQEPCGPDSPNPECEGADCSTFQPCNTPNSCSQPVCVTTDPPGGACVEGTTACAGLVLCPNGGGDCPPGSVCAVGTCCGENVCVPESAFCVPTSDGASAPVPAPVTSTGRTIATPQ